MDEINGYICCQFLNLLLLLDVVWQLMEPCEDIEKFENG